MQLAKKSPEYVKRVKMALPTFQRLYPKIPLDLYCKARIAMCLKVNGAAKDSFQRPTPLLSVTSYQ